METYPKLNDPMFNMRKSCKTIFKTNVDGLTEDYDE